ncbi:MAG: prolyl oligopeptidase family serine peptidase [Pseudomonadota bacterium]
MIRFLRRQCWRLAAAIGFASVAISVPAAADNAEGNMINAWIHDPVMSDVSISPDGDRLAALTIPTDDIFGAPFVTIWDLDDLSKEPQRLRPDDSKAIGIDWLNNDKIFVIGRRTIDFADTGVCDGKVVRKCRWFQNKWYIADASEGEIFVPRTGNVSSNVVAQPGLTSTLPNDPDHILINYNDGRGGRMMKVNVNTLRESPHFRIPDSAAGVDTDLYGEVLGKQEIEGTGKSTRIIQLYRQPGGSFQEHFDFRSESRRGVQHAGFSDREGVVYVVDNREGNYSVIREYNYISREFSDIIYSHPQYDVGGVILSTRKEDFGKLLGFSYQGPRVVREYVDEGWRNLDAGIQAVMPEGVVGQIVDWSDDFSNVVIAASGPQHPTQYYLLKDQSSLTKLGDSLPLLKPEMLGRMEFTSYEARDGLEIPAFITFPPEGTETGRAMVMPHGGPWARDFLGWDPLAQYFASIGYVVLQPQFRGSEGWGMELWRAGDEQWGLAMGDDNDDGARWLVERGYADADKIVIHGYSYGGYASMAASVRPNSPFQCAVSGAGLSELRTFRKFVGRSEFGEGFQEWTIQGLSPLDEARAGRQSIPILIYHGDRDNRVPIEQSRKFHDALEDAGGDSTYVEIVDLWHSFPWFPQHKRQIFETITDYLETDCGPGGLAN